MYTAIIRRAFAVCAFFSVRVEKASLDVMQFAKIIKSITQSINIKGALGACSTSSGSFVSYISFRLSLVYLKRVEGFFFSGTEAWYMSEKRFFFVLFSFFSFASSAFSSYCSSPEYASLRTSFSNFFLLLNNMHPAFGHKHINFFVVPLLTR